MVKKNTALILMFIFFEACFFGRRDLRHIPQKKMENSPIKLNGYYYDGDAVYFFYQNGKVFFGFNPRVDKMTEYRKEMTTHSDKNKYNKADPNWTNFVINGDLLFFERVYAAEGFPHKLFIGKILNDSTFVIAGSKLYTKKAPLVLLKDTFHFYEFSPKPDSSEDLHKF